VIFEDDFNISPTLQISPSWLAKLLRGNWVKRKLHWNFGN